uniref:Uncharacterized protein n=1 Tax=Panagrolaimus davidi TaxID=227884 RepID=A0A914P775_9BILA
MKKTAATDFIVPNNYKENEKSQPWNKSSNISTFATFIEDNDEIKKLRMNENTLKTTNESTLSLHISAYENPISSHLFGNENIAGLKKEKLVSIKKRCFTDDLKFRNPFEFPRQQDGDERNKPEIMEFKATQQLRGSKRPSSAEGKDDNDVEGGGGGEKGGSRAGENQSGQGKNCSDKKNGSDASPAGENIAAIGVGAVGTVMLKPNSDNTLEREHRKTSPPQNDTNNNGSSNNGSNNNKDIPNNANNEEQGNSGDENEEGGSDSETSDGFLKGLQSDDSFHGMLPDEVCFCW